MRWTSLLTATGLLANLATPAMASSRPGARLVSCHGESCVLVSGHRDNPAAMVLINGHAVPVEGGRGWKARLPVAALRPWCAPHARQIAVTVVDGDRPATVAMADLPIGLLGHIDLAMLTVRLR